MKLNAVGVVSNDFGPTVEFYKTLGFMFPHYTEADKHLEAMIPTESAKLMIDHVDLIKEILGYQPTPANHSAFAIEYGSADEVNNMAIKLKEIGGKLVKEPWDAFWGQRYCIVCDPDGYMIDLYAKL